MSRFSRMHRPARSASWSSALALALAVTSPTAATGQVPADAAQRVDDIFARWTSVTSPGCAVGVTKNGLTVLERAYGMAELEHAVPNTPETIFEGGSVSKQFTAAAVVLLALDGALSLDDDVRTFVPEIPAYGTTITLRHLLTHTSGLRDWGSVAGISGWGREQRSHDHADVLDILSRQSALNFEPGHEHSYSNSGFNLLAIVVARVSGKSFADFSTERIFRPLGMKSTQWRDDYRRLVAGRSSAYSALDGGRWEINRPIENVHGNGGILTTVGDLAIWNQALTDGRLGGTAFIEMMETPGSLNDGSPIEYAAGLYVRDFLGVPSVTHTGSTAGYRAFLGRYPDQGLGVAMLCNASNVPTGGTGGEIARVFLADAAEEPASRSRAAAAARDPERFAGLYRDPVTGSTRELRVESGTLRDGGAVLEPVSDGVFTSGGGSASYTFDGAAGSFERDTWETPGTRFERVEPWSPTRSELEALTGTYVSADAETTFVVRVSGDELTVWQRPDDTSALEPVYRDGFRSLGRVIRFRRDGSGRVTGLSLSLGRVYDMRFDRVGG